MKKKLGGILLVCLLTIPALTACAIIQEGKEQLSEQFVGNGENAVVEQLAQTAAPEGYNYAYGYLTESQQKLYREMYSVFFGFERDKKVSTVEPEELSHVFQCVMNDRPELFYVTGYTFTKYTSGNQVTKITISGTYSMPEEEAKRRGSAIEAYANTCLAGLPEGADDYTKVKYIYEYLILHTDYDTNAQDNQNICSVFLNGASVCQGYAKGMQYLLNRLSVPTTLVVGYVHNGEGHVWNLVQMDGAYYYVDPTWGDAFYQLSGDGAEQGQQLPNINYDYLGVTTSQLCATHTIDNIVPVPDCIQTQDNYYVREDAYFTAYDSEKLTRLFENGYAQGRDSVTVKCADAAVYGEMRRRLLEEQEVFHYLKDAGGSVAYTDSDEQMTVSFWL